VTATPTYARHPTAGGETIHALRTGWVRVKRTHRELDVVPGWRFPAIISQRDWAGWMPIVVYAIERSDGSLILVDTGPSPEILGEDYLACDPRGEWFYRRNLDFRVDAGDNLRDRMAEVGLDPAKVTDVVISHFHADHVGGLDLVPQARVLVGEGNWPKHTGSFTCNLAPGFAPTTAAFEPQAIGPFATSLPLTADGRVAMVPLPGHTPGHAGVAVRDGERLWIIAGDATFDDDQSERGAVSGATQEVPVAKKTQAQLAAALRSGAVLLPAHDPAAFAKLAAAGASTPAS
jgi:glyoxylase-like metal-dependent hydrolase (beta-lactamase superfamily II)